MELCKRTNTPFEGGRVRLVCKGLGFDDSEDEGGKVECEKYCEEHGLVLYDEDEKGEGKGSGRGFRAWIRDIIADVALLLRVAWRLGLRILGFKV